MARSERVMVLTFIMVRDVPNRWRVVGALPSSGSMSPPPRMNHEGEEDWLSDCLPQLLPLHVNILPHFNFHFTIFFSLF